MSLMSSVLPVASAKDSQWLTLEVCREYQRNKCSRSENECKFAHPPAHVEVNTGRVVCCFDSLKNRCNRSEPPCKYLHPPSHLRDQLLQNGRNNLILKNIQLGMLQQALLQQSGLLPIAPYLPLAGAAANLPHHAFFGGASPIPLFSPALAGEPGLLTPAAPAATAGLKVPASMGLLHPTSASPAAQSMFASTPPPHASLVAKLMQERCKPERGEMCHGAFANFSGKNGRVLNGDNAVASEPSQASLLAAAVVSVNAAIGAAGFPQSRGTPPAAALATMQLPTGQQAYIPAHPGPGEFATFAPSGHHSAIHRF